MSGLLLTLLRRAATCRLGLLIEVDSESVEEIWQSILEIIFNRDLYIIRLSRHAHRKCPL